MALLIKWLWDHRWMVVYIAIGLVVVAAFLIVNHWRNDSLALAAAQAADKQHQREAAEQYAALQEAYATVLRASRGYQDELAEIAARPVPSSPVRLCIKPARRAAGVPAGAAAGGPGAAVPAAGVVSSGDRADLVEGPDIGPDLRAFAVKCEQVSAQGRAIQGLH